MRAGCRIAIAGAFAALCALAADAAASFETFFGTVRGPEIPARVFSVADYGAKADGASKDTEAIRSARRGTGAYPEACAGAGHPRPWLCRARRIKAL